MLKALNAGGGGEVREVASSGWSEATLTWSSRPAATGAALSTLGRVEVGNVASFDVTRAVAGNGLHAFTISSTDPDGSGYHSRESTDRRPVLELVPGPRPAFPTQPPLDAGSAAQPPDAGAGPPTTSTPGPGEPDEGSPTLEPDAGTAPRPEPVDTTPEAEAKHVGGMTGGCSSAPSSLTGLLLTLGLVRRRRRGR